MYFLFCKNISLNNSIWYNKKFCKCMTNKEFDGYNNSLTYQVLGKLYYVLEEKEWENVFIVFFPLTKSFYMFSPFLSVFKTYKLKDPSPHMHIYMIIESMVPHIFQVIYLF